MDEARDIQVGAIVALHPHPHHPPVTFYVTAAHHDDDAQTVTVTGGWFSRREWADTYRATLPAIHPVTITATTWATTGGHLAHVVADNPSLTLCGALDPTPIPARLIRRGPVCRACSYQAVKAAAPPPAERFTFRILPPPAARPPAQP